MKLGGKAFFCLETFGLVAKADCSTNLLFSLSPNETTDLQETHHVIRCFRGELLHNVALSKPTETFLHDSVISINPISLRTLSLEE